jgi:hypothetical protein
VHPERRPAGFGAVAKAALAGVLALLLLSATTLSVSPSLHQSLHDRGGVNSDLCLACSLAKGQVNAAAPAVVLIAAISALFVLLPRLVPLMLPVSDRRLAPSRAPPSFGLTCTA